MNTVKINFFRGSIFQPERFKLDAIAVFIPAGLTAIRVNCKNFVKQFEKPTEKHEEFFLYKTNYNNDTLKSLRCVIVYRNTSHKIYDSCDISVMISDTLGRFSKLGVRRIGMNGIRTDSGIPELLIVNEVKSWLINNDNNFKEIYFIDLRGGFNKNIREYPTLLDECKELTMIEYTATRLTFKRDEIEQLNDGDYIKIHVIQDNATYKMTKREFYQTFDNVVSSKSYREMGNYNYGKTPSKALKYLI